MKEKIFDTVEKLTLLGVGLWLLDKFFFPYNPGVISSAKKSLAIVQPVNRV